MPKHLISKESDTIVEMAEQGLTDIVDLVLVWRGDLGCPLFISCYNKGDYRFY